MTDFREWMLKEMGKRNITCPMLAEMIGCAPRTICHYACGDRSPRLEVAEKILGVLGFRLEIIKNGGDEG